MAERKKEWPRDCVWPEPIDKNSCWYTTSWEDAELYDLNEEGDDLLETKVYYDGLVEDGILDDSYHLTEENEDYEIDSKYEEYWFDDHFDIESWEMDLSDCVNSLKLDIWGDDSVREIENAIGYDFINENLLRQAFTRRAFAIEYGLSGCSEELEFLGDSIISTVVTRAIYKNLADVDSDKTDAPFQSGRYKEGDFSKIRTSFTCGEYLSKCARDKGFENYILYGSSETKTDSALEDAIEAVVGAVAVDSQWNWDKLETVVDNLLCLQLHNPDSLLKDTHYDIFNSWHQRHFGFIPEYKVFGGNGEYDCIMRFRIPENDRGIDTYQKVSCDGGTRSKAREGAAFKAYCFVIDNRLWTELKNAELEPELEESINQLQELYQKKYVTEKAKYEFSLITDFWACSCVCDGIHGFGRSRQKTRAKKKASYMVLLRLLRSANLCDDDRLREADSLAFDENK